MNVSCKVPAKFSNGVYTIFRFLFMVLFKILFRIKVEGIDNLPREGGCVVAANHVSFLDPVVLGVASPRRFNFLARESLFHNKLFGRLLPSVGAIPLRRGKIDPQAMKEALRRLGRGEILVLFPEGTRSPDGTLKKGKEGVAFLAVRAKVPIIPAYLSGTERALPRDARFIRLASVRVTFGKEINREEFSGSGEEYDYQRAADLVMERIFQLKVK